MTEQELNDKRTTNLHEIVSTLKTLIAYYESKVTPRKPLRKIRWALACAVECVEKQIPKKPQFVDTRFRSHGKHISDGQSVDKCYKCPSCNTHIFHVFDDENYCVHCGQKLDWSEV